MTLVVGNVVVDRIVDWRIVGAFMLGILGIIFLQVGDKLLRYMQSLGRWSPWGHVPWSCSRHDFISIALLRWRNNLFGTGCLMMLRLWVFVIMMSFFRNMTFWHKYQDIASMALRSKCQRIFSNNCFFFFWTHRLSRRFEFMELFTLFEQCSKILL